jgi:Xaa-Pro aminopeptidase
VGELARDARRLPSGAARIGYQREALPYALQRAVAGAAGDAEWHEVDELLQDLQRRKDPDEVECIRRSIAATLAGYSRAQAVIRPGISELEVMTECQAAAQRCSGEVHFYNGDFRSGELGGFARNRPIERGELYIIDAWSDLGGYWCDMSRTWSVGGEPTDLQQSVYAHLAAILRAVPELARIGRSTREFWAELDSRIREHPHLAKDGLIHHGGHGIGLRAHEAPDLNRDRGGAFEVGTVFTCEPGGYSDELRRGVRIENLFLVTEAGTTVLSEYPLSLRAEGPSR